MFVNIQQRSDFSLRLKKSETLGLFSHNLVDLSCSAANSILPDLRNSKWDQDVVKR